MKICDKCKSTKYVNTYSLRKVVPKWWIVKIVYTKDFCEACASKLIDYFHSSDHP